MMVVTEIKEHTEVFVISINQQDLVPEQLRKTRQEWFCVYVTHSVVGRNGKFMTGEYFKEATEHLNLNFQHIAGHRLKHRNKMFMNTSMQSVM